MPRTLSAYTTTALDSPHTDLVRLCVITWSGLTLRFCDRAFGTAPDRHIYDGEIYEPLILSTPAIQSGKIDSASLENTPGEGQVVFDNSVPVGGYDRLSLVFKDYSPQFAAVTLYLVPNHATSADDAEVLLSGTIEDVTQITPLRVQVMISSLELDIQNKFPVAYVNTDVYADADPDDVGKMLPVPYGICKRVPFRSVDAGWVTTLAVDLTISGTSVYVSDASGFTTSGTIQIDAEKISYTGITTNTLTGATRGASSTTATAHDAGAYVAQVQTYYFYICGAPVHSIDAVYVGGIRQSGNYLSYTGQSGQQHGTYGALAVIRFNTLPLITRQVNLEIDDTNYSVVDASDVNDSTLDVNNTALDVADDIDFDDPGHQHATDYAVYVWKFDAATDHASVAFEELMLDLNMRTYSTYNSNVSITVSKAVWDDPGSINDEIYQFRVCLHTGLMASNTRFTFSFAGRSKTSVNGVDYTTYKSDWYTPGSSYNTWTEFNAATGTVSRSTGSGSSIASVWVEVRYYPAATAVVSAPVARDVLTDAWLDGDADVAGEVTYQEDTNLSGYLDIVGNSAADTVIGGAVTVDVHGIRDTTGDYGGSGTMIERPDWVIKHILVGQCGLSASDLDSVTYTASGTEYGTESYAIAACLLQKPNVRNLVNRIAYQSRSLEYWSEGKHHLQFIPEVESSDRSIGGGRIDINQVYLRYTDRTYLQNSMTARYDYEWAGYTDEETAYRASVTATHASSIATYGTLEKDAASLQYVASSAQAQDILEWRIADLSHPRLIIELSGSYNLLDLKIGDLVNFGDVGTSDYTDLALSGMVSAGYAYRVLAIAYKDTSIRLTLVRHYVPSEYWEVWPDVYWSPEPAWDIPEWSAGFLTDTAEYDMNVQVIGTWADSYRPTKIRITHNATASVYVGMIDTASLVIFATGQPYVSGSEHSISWASSDIHRLKMQNFTSTFNVTDIEFYSGGQWISYT